MKKNRLTTLFYFVAPTVALIVFVFAYSGYRAREHQKEEQARIAEAQQVAAKDAEKRDIEQKLAAEAKRLAEAKEAARLEKEQREHKELDDQLLALRQRLLTTQADIDRTQSEMDELQSRIDSLRTARLDAEKVMTDLSLQVEALAARRSAADLESQRLTDVLMSFVQREWTPPAIPPAR